MMKLRHKILFLTWLFVSAPLFAQSDATPLENDGDKPVIPISRPVIRSLNECMKLYKEIIKDYGVPSRVVIETTRELRDGGKKGQQSIRHRDNMKFLYDSIQEQIKERRNNCCNWSYYLYYI